MNTSQNRERFISLAEQRVIKAIKIIRLIGNLSNKTNYNYTEDDVKKIIGVLRSEIRNIEQRFNNKGQDKEILFKL